MTATYVISRDENFQNVVGENCDMTSLKFCKNNYVTKNNQNYKVLRYDKNYLTFDVVPTQGLFRSVIVNQEKKVVCFAPPKSYSIDTFTTMYPDRTEDIVAEEFVEGTMNNVFWDPSAGLSGCWEIATRNSIGGEVSFFKSGESMTFRAMFMEAANDVNLDINTLNRNYCYSFVLQHPKNRIVVPFKTSAIILTNVYEICNTEDGSITVSCIDIEEVKKTKDLSITNVSYPERIMEWSSYTDLKNNYASMNTRYDVLGVVIYNTKTGVRTKMRNPTYENVRQLRGNQPKLQYQYLSLRKSGSVGEYLKYYPEHKKEFSSFRDNMHKFTNTLYQNYISCYIKKERVLKEFPDNFRTHMFNIHRNYIDELKPNGGYVNNSFVINFVNDMPVTLQMYSLNFSMRQRKTDIDSIQLEQNQEKEPCVDI